MGAALQRAAIASQPRYERRRPEQTPRAADHFEIHFTTVRRIVRGCEMNATNLDLTPFSFDPLFLFLIDWIISGDNDLLCLGRYAGIAIIPPATALALIAGG